MVERNEQGQKLLDRLPNFVFSAAGPVCVAGNLGLLPDHLGLPGRLRAGIDSLTLLVVALIGCHGAAVFMTKRLQIPHATAACWFRFCLDPSQIEKAFPPLARMLFWPVDPSRPMPREPPVISTTRRP